MQVEDFNFHLPENLIAQTPLKDRTASKLMVVDRKTGAINHHKFADITDFLESGDVLVLNDTRVMPARLFGIKEDTNANIEVLLLKHDDNNNWETLVRPAKRVKIGTRVNFGNGKLIGECVDVLEDGGRVFKFHYEGIFYEVLDALGEMPLPPYIHEKLEDKERYQTVYSKEIGSAAAPTAGLHFTEDLLTKLRDKNITICFVTLHVGLGTFRPVAVDDINAHKMHSEFYLMPKETAEILNKAKKEKRRIISVGTTSTRTLETIARDNDGIFKESTGWTDIFIYPGYQFQAIDGLITNFHLPKSTLIMLVSAFSSKDIILNAYNEAVNEEYRFFSFGDSMFIR